MADGDRLWALGYLNSQYDVMYTTAMRGVLDDAAGYQPVLDRAFRQYGQTPVLATDLTGFEYLLDVLAIESVLPLYCSQFADAQIDAPLTKVSGGQLCRNLQQLLAARRLLLDASGLVTSPGAFVGGYRLNMDYLEPGVDAFPDDLLPDE